MQNKITIRAATNDDAGTIADIYGSYVQNTAVTFDYEAPSAADIATRINDIQKRHPYLVAEVAGQVVGFSYADALRHRPAYDWAVETTIYVDPNIRRSGVSRALYTALQTDLEARGVLNLYALVAAAATMDPYLTEDSIHFHERMGYAVVGTLHQCGFKFQRWYDVHWMEKHLGAHTASPKPFVSLQSNASCKGEMI